MVGKKKNIPEEIQLTENSKAIINKKEGIIKIVTEKEKTGEDNIEMLEFFSEQSGIPIFKGKIGHAYESDFLGYKNFCPKCDAPTQQMMSSFAYGTQEASRIMSAPAGHFCTHCPTVIIDDDIMKSSIDKKFKYGGVFRIETGYEDLDKLFETFNGEKPVFILDEFKENVYGIIQSVHQSSADFDAIYSSSSETQKQKSIAQQKQK